LNSSTESTSKCYVLIIVAETLATVMGFFMHTCYT